MDLQAGERVLDQLEHEAVRLRGLGDLRQQIDAALQTLAEHTHSIAATSTSLAAVARTSEQSRQEVFARLQEFLNGLERRLDELQAGVNAQLGKNGDAIRTGLVQIHRQVQELALQIDRGVKAELARSSGELRNDLNTAVGAVGRQVDLTAREQHQALQAGLAELRASMDSAVRALGRQIRVAAISVGAIVAVGITIVIWLLVRG